MKNFGQSLAKRLAKQHDLTYRTQVNLEATINGLIYKGLTQSDVTEMMEDIFDNLAFVNFAPIIIPGKGLTKVMLFGNSKNYTARPNYPHN